MTWYSLRKQSKPRYSPCKKARTLVWTFFLKSSRTFSKREETKQKNGFSRKFKMQTYPSVRPIWKMTQKPFLQCFACQRTFSGSRVIAEKPPSKTINCLLQSLTLWCPLGFGDFRKKHLNASGFAREFLQSGMLYRPGKSLKRHGKSSSLHSKKNFFAWEMRVFCEWRHKWRTFRPPWPTLPGPGHQPLCVTAYWSHMIVWDKTARKA